MGCSSRVKGRPGHSTCGQGGVLAGGPGKLYRSCLPPHPGPWPRQADVWAIAEASPCSEHHLSAQDCSITMETKAPSCCPSVKLPRPHTAALTTSGTHWNVRRRKSRALPQELGLSAHFLADSHVGWAALLCSTSRLRGLTAHPRTHDSPQSPSWSPRRSQNSPRAASSGKPLAKMYQPP